MQAINSLPTAAELLKLGPQEPQVANDILRIAGHAELSQEYMDACNVLHRCSVAALQC